MSMDLVISIGITLIGWAVMFGICKNKIDNNEKAIQDLKKDIDKDISQINVKQNQTDTILQSINNLLASVNSKVDLLIDGKIKCGDDLK